MKTFILSVLAMIGISIGAYAMLETYQRTADAAYVGYGAKPDPEPSLRGTTLKR